MYELYILKNIFAFIKFKNPKNCIKDIMTSYFPELLTILYSFSCGT